MIQKYRRIRQRARNPQVGDKEAKRASTWKLQRSIPGSLGNYVTAKVKKMCGAVCLHVRKCIQRAGDPLGNATFTYDTRGLRTGATLPCGVAAQYDYDAVGRPVCVTYRRGVTLIAAFSYSYDAAGDLLVEQLGTAARHFSYDQDGRLISATGPGQPTAALFTPNTSRDGAATTFASTNTSNKNIWISRQFSINQLETNRARIDSAAGQTVTLHWGISSPAIVGIAVINNAGHTVRTLLATQHRNAGSATTEWDGRDGQGRPVPEGTYSLQLTAQAPDLQRLQRGFGVSIDNVSLHGTLLVRATLAGKPARGVTLLAYESGGAGQFVTQAVRDGNGAANLSLSAGCYNLLAEAAGGATATLDGIAVAQHSTQQRAIALVAPTNH
jgi:YD repeat-containing protein